MMMDWINLAQDKVECQAVDSGIMMFGLHKVSGVC